MTRESIQSAINAWDPMNIIDRDDDGTINNFDEYDAEVDVICRCLARCGGTCSTEKLSEILRVVFAEYFDDKSLMHSLKRRENGKTFEQVAEEILRDETTDGTSISAVKSTCARSVEAHEHFLKEFGEGANARPIFLPPEVRIMTELFDKDFRTKFLAQLACLKILERTYSGRKPALEVWLSLEFVIAEILRADTNNPDDRCRDAAKDIIALADTPEKILQLGQPRVEEILASHNVRVKSSVRIINLAQNLQEDYGGEIPRSFGELEKLFGEYPVHAWVRFELLVAVILSAQCTDKRVNEVTKILFPIANTPEKILQLGQARLEEIIRPCGFYHMKAKHILETSRILLESYGGEVPGEFDELVKLPGVGRKTANVILSVSFGSPALAVDTHVFRLANRLQLAEGKTPLEVENGLKEVIPRSKWSEAHHWLIWHGREICTARKPKCSICPLFKICPSAQ